MMGDERCRARVVMGDVGVGIERRRSAKSNASGEKRLRECRGQVPDGVVDGQGVGLSPASGWQDAFEHNGWRVWSASGDELGGGGRRARLYPVLDLQAVDSRRGQPV